MRNFILSFLILVSNLVFGQAIVTTSTISVQGVLFSDNGSPISDFDNISLDFKIYYIDSSSSSQIEILSETENVSTNSFGVFNHVINLNKSKYNEVSFYPSWVSITYGTNEIFNQQLRSVPYSIYSKNGYQTGMILPYVGDVAPQGWLLCDGQEIPNDFFHKELRDLFSSNKTPNLKGVFLRGASDQTDSSKYDYGPVNEYQRDGIKEHRHEVSITTTEDGEHNHAIRRDSHAPGGTISANDGYAMMSSNSYDEGFYPNSTNSVRNEDLMKYDGEHTHQVNGYVDYYGGQIGVDSYPVNYGINYIIKI